MDGHAAHRDLLARMLATAGEGDVQHAACNPRIFKEKFEKVAHAVEEQAILGLRLEREILGHHRGGSGHGHRLGVAPRAGNGLESGGRKLQEP